MNNEKEISLLRNLFMEIVNPKNDREPVPVHDIFVQVDPERGDVTLFNEDDVQLATCTIFSWAENPATELTPDMLKTLRETVSVLEQRGFWDNPLFVQPLAVELVDEEMQCIERLLYLDDEVILLNEPLLKDLNQDLNKFLDEILGDIK